MKNLTVGKKIVLGFSLILFIAVLLGGVAIWNFRGITDVSNKLAHEYVPEVKVANNVERYRDLEM